MKFFYRILFMLFPRRRWGKFWCSEHWALVSVKPVDVDIAALGVVIAINENVEAKANWVNHGKVHACCQIPAPILDGIIDRSKGWVKA